MWIKPRMKIRELNPPRASALNVLDMSDLFALPGVRRRDGARYHQVRNEVDGLRVYILTSDDAFHFAKANYAQATFVNLLRLMPDERHVLLALDRQRQASYLKSSCPVVVRLAHCLNFPFESASFTPAAVPKRPTTASATNPFKAVVARAKLPPDPRLNTQATTPLSSTHLV